MCMRETPTGSDLEQFIQHSKETAQRWEQENGYPVYVPEAVPNPSGWSGPHETVVTDTLGHQHYYNEQGQQVGYR